MEKENFRRMMIRLLPAAVAVLSVLCIWMCLKQRNQSERAKECMRQLSFAMEIVKRENIDRPEMQASVISHVYAAYTQCDDVHLAGKIYDLWNDLVFRGLPIFENGKTLGTALNLLLGEAE